MEQWAGCGPGNGAWDVGKTGGRCDLGRGTILYRNCTTLSWATRGHEGTNKAQFNIVGPSSRHGAAARRNKEFVAGPGTGARTEPSLHGNGRACRGMLQGNEEERKGLRNRGAWVENAEQRQGKKVLKIVYLEAQYQ